jgi:hypothetical protein
LTIIVAIEVIHDLIRRLLRVLGSIDVKMVFVVHFD